METSFGLGMLASGQEFRIQVYLSDEPSANNLAFASELLDARIRVPLPMLTSPSKSRVKPAS